VVSHGFLVKQFSSHFEINNVEDTLKKKVEFCSISAGIILPDEKRMPLLDSYCDHIKPLLRVIVKKPSNK
jgi:hypothetical protein